jgi:hypothetical protein
VSPGLSSLKSHRLYRAGVLESLTWVVLAPDLSCLGLENLHRSSAKWGQGLSFLLTVGRRPGGQLLTRQRDLGEDTEEECPDGSCTLFITADLTELCCCSQ